MITVSKANARTGGGGGGRSGYRGGHGGYGGSGGHRGGGTELIYTILLLF